MIQSQMIASWAFMISMEIGPHFFCFPSPIILQMIYSTSHKSWLSYFVIIHYYLLPSLMISGFCRQRYIYSEDHELALAKSRICTGAESPWPVKYWCGSLNFTVRKGFHSMPAMECWLGGPNVACGDAVSKYLHYTRQYVLESWAAELEKQVQTEKGHL